MFVPYVLVLVFLTVYFRFPGLDAVLYIIIIVVRSVRSDRKMKARLGKIILNVSVWVAVIVSLRGGLEKLSGEESGVTKAEVESCIHLVLADQIEFVADVAAGAGVGWNRNRSAAGVEIVV